MQTFSQFVKNKTIEELAEAILTCNFNEEILNEEILNEEISNFDPKLQKIFNEFWGGVGNVLGAGANAVGRGINAAGQGAWNAAKTVGNAIGSEVKSAGKDLYNTGQAAWNAGKAGLNAAKQGMTNIGNVYTQGEIKSNFATIVNQIQKLQKNLQSAGYAPEQIGKFMTNLNNIVQYMNSQQNNLLKSQQQSNPQQSQVQQPQAAPQVQPAT